MLLQICVKRWTLRQITEKISTVQRLQHCVSRTCNVAMTMTTSTMWQSPTSDRSIAPCRHVSGCQPVSMSSTRCHLRSAAHADLVELRRRTTRYGKRSFPASAPLIWNSLWTTVRDVSISVNSFSERLKAELFRTSLSLSRVYTSAMRNMLLKASTKQHVARNKQHVACCKETTCCL